jgi:hypothetical protein
MPIPLSRPQSLVIDSADRRDRSTRADARHLAALRKTGVHFDDVSAAVLAFERLCDPRPMPPPEITIRSTGLMCIESPLAEFEVDERVNGTAPMVPA